MAALSPISPSGSGSKPSRQTARTGVQRFVSDTVAEFYNITEQWRKLNLDSVQVLKEMANCIKFQNKKSEDKKSTRLQYRPENINFSASFCSYSDSDSEGESVPSILNDHSPDLSSLSNDLLHNYNLMKGCIERLNGLVEKYKQLIPLHTHDSKQPVFNTWTTDKFGVALSEVFQCYREELDVKSLVTEKVAHSPDKSTLMFYLTTWTYEYMIDSDCQLKLLAMVKEANL